MALANMTQIETDNHNRETCKQIALNLEAYANGNIYRCPDCGEIHHIENENNGEELWFCPNCRNVKEFDDLEQLSLWDYFDDILDIKYLIGHDRETVEAVKILITFGGPNIYIDTESRAVELYWWTDRASYPIDHDVCNQIDEWAQELFTC